MNLDNNPFKQLAIIGSTASGKTSLAIKVAKQLDAYILSLDSLAIYKDIDIVSAKPTLDEREGIKHFGIDVITPKNTFDVTVFIALYHDVYQQCQEDGKNLIIVGGTGFYLKMLLEGVSEVPNISQKTKDEASIHLQDLDSAYEYLYTIDPTYMIQIKPQDAYRIEKALHLYLETLLTPTVYFKRFPPKPTIVNPLPIYQIEWDRTLLRKRIALRTQIMLNDGLIDEICMLEKKYTRTPNCMKSIGIIETLGYLDGKYDKKQLIEKITTHTARLAKRQTTFNNSQFKEVTKGSIGVLERMLLENN